MVKFETAEIAGFAPAIAGIRHALQSYDKADSHYDNEGILHIGENDYDLAKRLINSNGDSHSKFLRQIEVWVNITAPRFWWAEFDTYKIATTANSQSTMHTLIKTSITKENIGMPWGLDPTIDSAMENLIYDIDCIINFYKSMDENKELKDKYFEAIKAMLPEGFLQTRMISLNYQVLRNMYEQRKTQRLSGWNKDFVEWVHTLPLSEWITNEWPEYQEQSQETVVDSE